ncbi:GNAT family N-acetyltransferase [Microbacterium sp. 179-I 1D1 NHS]|uniref:GNAT family N-acetyltransferase n=1 Tax=Microbacterium sp. 179-I 1D1 NHS TaxID=3374298 RepID=UPI00387A823F
MRITTDLAEIDLGVVHRWLSEGAYWALGRPRDVVERAAQNSLNFYAQGDDGTPLGYARVVTDSATFAWLCDVYVDPGARGKAVGKALVGAVVDALEPLGLKRTLLVTADAHGLYEQFGFTLHPNPERVMQRGG